VARPTLGPSHARAGVRPLTRSWEGEGWGLPCNPVGMEGGDLVDLSVIVSPEGVAPGAAYLSDTPVLRGHAGTQPDLFLCWNAIPAGAPAIDIVVHLHGFSSDGSGMLLSEKVSRAGLDLSARGRPTLALMPRGNWIRYSWYDFPALLAGGLDRLVDHALSRFSAATGIRPALERFVLTAHSGGGMPAVDAIAGALRPPDELFVFDGLYGRDPAGGDPMQGLEVVDRWLGERLAGEPMRAGAIRVIYIEQQTGPFSREVQALIDRRLSAFAPDLAASFARRYRVERSGVPHAQIARRCHKALLADAGCTFDWLR
jgi:hypothetical protein